MSDRSTPADDEPTDARSGENEDEDERGADEWRFGIDEVGENAERDRTIDPGSPSLENAAFVLLGVLLTALFVLTAL